MNAAEILARIHWLDAMTEQLKQCNANHHPKKTATKAVNKGKYQPNETTHHRPSSDFRSSSRG
jgi:hypothetical protein